MRSKNSAMRVVASARESMAPVLKESAFHERGVLTPDEFVLAGDLLVTRCPTCPPLIAVHFAPKTLGKPVARVPQNEILICRIFVDMLIAVAAVCS